jgi:predicted nucleic acid-binding protein
MILKVNILAEKGIRLVLDVNIVRGIVKPRGAHKYRECFIIWGCIQEKNDCIKVVVCNRVRNAYEEHFTKQVIRMNSRLWSRFTLPLIENNQYEFFEGDDSTNDQIQKIGDPDDQCYIDCATKAKVDYIISNDSDFKKDFDDSKTKFKCLTAEEFDNKHCKEN